MHLRPEATGDLAEAAPPLPDTPLRLVEVRAHSIRRVFGYDDHVSLIPSLYDKHQYVHKMAQLRAEPVDTEEETWTRRAEGGAKGARKYAEQRALSFGRLPTRGHTFKEGRDVSGGRGG